LANPILVKAWFKKAIKDYKAAKALLTLDDDDHLETIAYLTQQCIEKCLKGYLVYSNQRIAKTHNLDELAVLARKIEGAPSYLASKSKLLSTITDYAYIHRYPDAVKKPKPLTKKAVKTAIDFAEKCFFDFSTLAKIHSD
jgi:HEPN domain-containing protein